MEQLLKPKILTLFNEGYTKKEFLGDLFAGIIVGILAFPMSLAFAIASGARPEQGVYTALVAGFLGAIFSGSRVQVTGPTGAFTILIFTTIAQFGYSGLVIATLMAGAMLIAAGFSRFGTAIKFIPYPVTIGFTSGIALLIFTSQISDFFGMPLDTLPAGFLDKWILFAKNFIHINMWALGLGVVSIVIISQWYHLTTKIPGSLIAIVVGTLAVQFLGIPVETVGDRFPAPETFIPTFQLPTIEWAELPKLINPAIAIALLAGIESLLSAVVADGMTGHRHRSSMELISQGIANIGSVLFGGIPATGAIARTATSIKNGAKTPIASIIHVLVLLLIVLVLGPWVSKIPMATLAALLIVVAYNMSEWRHFVHLFWSPKSDIFILLTTFLLTVFVDLIVAIEVGLVLAAFLFIDRISRATQFKSLAMALQDSEEEQHDPQSIADKVIDKDIEVFEIYGPFFFAAMEKFKAAMDRIHDDPKVLILRMRHVFTLDGSGIRALEDIFDKTRREGTILILSGISSEIHAILDRQGFTKLIGEENVCKDIDTALARANALVDEKDLMPKTK